MLSAQEVQDAVALKNRNKQLVDNFLEAIKSPATKVRALSYVHRYMEHWMMFDENGTPQYVQLVTGTPQQIEEKISHFVIIKKRQGLGAAGIDNYIDRLHKFLKANQVKGVDFDAIRAFLPEKVKKYKDREYFEEEVFAIEDHLDEKGKVVSGIIRGSGIRRGGEPTVNIGDIFPKQTKYGKIYKIWVYRGTKDEYPTACIPEVAKRIDDYLDMRLRFGEVCPQFGTDHSHEYIDGIGDNAEAITKFFKADERHLDPDAPLIRDDFDRRVVATKPKRLSESRMSDIVRDAAIKAGIRVVNKGNKYKRHKVMVTHGLRKLFKKRCRQAKMDRIILERFMGHGKGNPKEGITKLMMTYDPEDWEEMEQEFIKAIPHLTLSKDARFEAQLAETSQKLEEKTRENAELERRLQNVERQLGIR